ncbi:AtpZ/AtpI family protein [Sphingobacterium sp. UT-1RO-CII-1]|nr:AtpZ/AtpI family protein [Sphingobacterium sp. UT-1RO-CII-1]
MNWIGIPFQMVVIVFVGYWGGAWLDNSFKINNKWGTIGLTLFALLISLYQLVKQIQRIEKKSK